jgi:hypothetical protein
MQCRLSSNATVGFEPPLPGELRLFLLANFIAPHKMPRNLFLTRAFSDKGRRRGLPLVVLSFCTSTKTFAKGVSSRLF